MTAECATEALRPVGAAETVTRSRREDAISPGMLVLLAFIAAASPLAIDLYLASFPRIQRDLSTTPTMVQLTLTAYLVGVSIGQPIWGPLSDRFGRRRPLIVSNSITVVSSALVALAPTIHVLIAARFVQALSAASGMVIARAIVSDKAQGYAGVRALTLMMTVFGVVPVVAPTLGGVLATFLPWRGVLLLFAAIVVGQLLACIFVLSETLPPVRRSRRLSYGDLARVLARPAFLTYGLTLGIALAVMMAYVGSASFVYQKGLGFSALGFGLVFAANAIAMLAAGTLNSRLARRQVHPVRTVGGALPFVVVCCLSIAAVGASPWPQLIVLPAVLNAFFINLATGNCMALAMGQAQGIPGAGSAVLGLFMFGFGALVTPLSSLLGGASSPVSMGLLMGGLALCAAMTFALGRRWLQKHSKAEIALG